MKTIGVVGWKNTGKTGLVERLVREFTGLGFSVSTLKHAHHGFDPETPGTDSFRHRAAGAAEVLVASGHRWALMSELRSAEEPSLQALVARLAPVDLVIVEGWKRATHPKIETHLSQTEEPPIARGDTWVRAVVSDVTPDVPCPVLPIDRTDTVAEFIRQEIGL